MDGTKILARHKLRFIEARRRGSWLILEPLLRSFSCPDGDTRDVWDLERCTKDLRDPAPTLLIDQAVIRVDGDTAVLSGRTRKRGTHRSCYLDTYARRGEDWLCVHACGWTLRGPTVAG